MIESFIDRNYQEIDTTESFGKEKKKKWRIRTHYAMPYGNIRMTDQATNRAMMFVWHSTLLFVHSS